MGRSEISEIRRPKDRRKKTCYVCCSCLLVVIGGFVTICVIGFAVAYPPKASSNAVLQEFALRPGSPAANSTVSYNITATLFLWNPNMYRVIKFGPVAAAFSFNGSRFDESTVPGFENAAQNTATFQVTASGVDKPINLTATAVKEFQAENETAIFDVELRLDTVMQYKGRKAACPLVIICPLKLQVVDPFQVTKCALIRAMKSGC
ncbi:hypothetical protein ACP70R_021902 [Stipagrostis hirtigluma subsp. patula]